MTIPLEALAAGAIALALNAYVLAGGADFGGGVWDALAAGPRRQAHQQLIADAIGPIWEANHVWLIIAVVILFTCFPPAFALVGITLHIPLAIALIGIVLRGSAFTFRTYGDAHTRGEERWSRVFAVASIVTPVFLGVAVGAIASERVVPPPPGATFVEAYIAPWLTPFSLAVGVLALALFAFLAAVYLTVEAESDRALQEDYRRRALWCAALVIGVAGLALWLARGSVPGLRSGLLSSSWAGVFHLATAATAVLAVGTLVRRAYRVARVAAAGVVTLIFWGWALAQYPYLIPPTLTVDNAAAPPITLRLTLVALAAGAVVLFPSLLYLYRVFKTDPATARAAARELAH